MPDTVLITALILERPHCIRCLAGKAGLSAADLDAAIGVIERVLTLHRRTDRCVICDRIDTVFSADRPH